MQNALVPDRNSSDLRWKPLGRMPSARSVLNTGPKCVLKDMIAVRISDPYRTVATAPSTCKAGARRRPRKTRANIVVPDTGPLHRERLRHGAFRAPRRMWMWRWNPV